MATALSPASHIRSICYASNPPKTRISFPDSGIAGSWSASANYVKLQVAARGVSGKPLVVTQTWKKRGFCELRSAICVIRGVLRDTSHVEEYSSDQYS